MKRLGADRGSLVVCVVVWLLLTAGTLYGAWALLTGNWHMDEAVLAAAGIASGREKWIMMLGVPLFGVCAVYLALRLFYSGIGYVLYNEEMVTFVLNRRERRSYRWQDLIPSGVYLRDIGEIEPVLLPFLQGWFFEFPDGKRMPVRAMMKGYPEFEALLYRKGLLSRAGWR